MASRVAAVPSGSAVSPCCCTICGQDIPELTVTVSGDVACLCGTINITGLGDRDFSLSFPPGAINGVWAVPQNTLGALWLLSGAGALGVPHLVVYTSSDGSCSGGIEFEGDLDTTELSVECNLGVTRMQIQGTDTVSGVALLLFVNNDVTLNVAAPNGFTICGGIAFVGATGGTATVEIP